MADELYSKQGEKLGFQHVLDLTYKLSKGEPAAFMETVMPVAYDRYFRAPIYELHDKTTDTSFDPKYIGAFYPKSGGVVLNPRYTDRVNDAMGGARNTINHEMYHYAVSKDKGLIDRADALIEKNPEARRIRDSVGDYMQKAKMYELSEIPEETQAHLFSGTTTRSLGATPTDKKLFAPSLDYLGQAASKTVQETMYPALQGIAKNRFQYARPKVQEDVPEQGYVKSALDKFMSIIGLGPK